MSLDHLAPRPINASAAESRGRRYSAPLLAAVLVGAISFAGGCMDVALAEADLVPSSTPEPECRGRFGIVLIWNASGHGIVRVWLADLDAPDDSPAPGLSVKELGDTPIWYEILFMDCRPRRTRLRMEVSTGDLQQTESTVTRRSIMQLASPAGIH